MIYQLKLWQLYLDLEINLGSVESIKHAYSRCIELKVASPFVMLSYASFLESHKFFEESFKIYEQGLTMFSWPTLYDFWIVYLTKFVKRYQGTRLERTRDLFETALKTCPSKHSRVFYLMYADFEEKFGLINHVIEIYDRLSAQDSDN